MLCRARNQKEGVVRRASLRAGNQAEPDPLATQAQSDSRWEAQQLSGYWYPFPTGRAMAPAPIPTSPSLTILTYWSEHVGTRQSHTHPDCLSSRRPRRRLCTHVF